MSSAKCPHCGLVNFAGASDCKRCQKPLSRPAAVNAPNDPSATVPVGYTMAPRPSRNEPYQFETTIRRDGKLLVVTEDTVFPERCVRCNASCTKMVKRTEHWAPAYVILAGLLSPTLLALLYGHTSETATIYVGLCDSHYNRRYVGMIVAGLLIGMGLATGLYNIYWHDYWLLFYGGVLILIGAFVSALFNQTVTVKKIEGQYIWLKGIHPNFLDSFTKDQSSF